MHSIRISKCLSVQGDTEQRRPDCMEPNDRGSDVQGILGHIQEEILYLQTCEPDEKDFRIGVAFGYCREAVNAYITTSYGASWKEHDLQQMVSGLKGIWKIYSPMKHSGKMQRMVT